jgi:AcrR family transcriptional regulator
MGDDISGKGDPLKTIQLLWGKAPPSRRGPKARLALPEIVAAAVGIADRDGLSALTTRRVAETLGISPMSVYTYVPGKDELLDLMLDGVLGEIKAPQGKGWREKLADVARQNWALALRHPWMLEVATHRPVLGPNVFAKYDAELAAVDGIGLDELEMDRVLTLVLDYVSGAVRGAARERWVKERTGMTDTEWWQKVEPYLNEVVTDWNTPYPVAARVGPVVGEAYGAHDPEGSFAFGLERLLDGLAILIEKRSRLPGKTRT